MTQEVLANDPDGTSQERQAFLRTLRTIVGWRHVLTSRQTTRRYRTGFRFGTGSAAAVVRPATLLEQWRVVKACAAANRIVIMQAANTGLTGGSTPCGDDYDREVVIVNTLRITGIRLINEGCQVICLSGTTLFQLESALKRIGREPHSVIGSSCIGASVIGGVCNNSGGSLIQRGPAYTQLTLFARISPSGEVELVNHLGIRLGAEPEEILRRLERNDFCDADIERPADAHASDGRYRHDVREVDAETPGRFNADPARLFEASGSAGKVVVFAVRLDTFPVQAQSRCFYIGTNDPAELTRIRRNILTHFDSLPIEAEYIHRTAFDIAEEYGKDTFLAIAHLGTRRLPALFALKATIDALADRLRILPDNLSDRILQRAAALFPRHLPPRMKAFRDRFEHHLLLRAAGPCVDETRRYLGAIFPSSQGSYFECSDAEGRKAFLHRFAVAGAAVRYRSLHRAETEGILALDVALRRNDAGWFESLPDDIDSQIALKIYYGHFFCHVFHQDYVVRKGCNAAALEHRMLALLDGRGARYPAEHNVGHLYKAAPELVAHYKTLDPCNCLNAGIGLTSKLVHWREPSERTPPSSDFHARLDPGLDKRDGRRGAADDRVLQCKP